ncbi:MAG: hypothetical protein J0M24_18145 [Verrucomicrobia bacterium]|nr:hypothetical protein [Verrucomicrobiota bacterium]
MKRNLLVLATALSALAFPASATITQMPDRVTLGATDSIQWDVLGTSGTSLSRSFSLDTVLGHNVNVRGQFSSLRLDQGDGWTGDFLNGSQLLASDGNFLFEINPDGLFQGAGLEIDTEYLGDYTAKMVALDANGTVLGTVRGEGTATGSADDSALFLGFLSDAIDVDRFVVRLTSAAARLDQFAINHVNLVFDVNDLPGPIAPVPEAKNAALMGGLALLIAGAWRRARSRQG